MLRPFLCLKSKERGKTFDQNYHMKWYSNVLGFKENIGKERSVLPLLAF